MPPEASAVAVPSHGRLRRSLVVLLVVLACLGIVLTAVTWWLHYTALNTDGYLKVVGPVAQDEQVQADLSAYLAGQIISVTDLQDQAVEVLPPKAQFLAGPITDEVEQWMTKVIQRLLASDRAYEAWIGINRFAHERAVGLLRGDNKYTYIEGEDVKVNTLPLISQALQRVDERAPRLFGEDFTAPVITPDTPVDDGVAQLQAALGRPLPPEFGQFTLVSSSKIETAQTAVRVFDAIVIVLPIVTLALIAAAVYFARRRLRVVIWLAIGAAAALLAARILIKQLYETIVNDLGTGSVRHVAGRIMSAAIEPILNVTLWLVIAGIVVGVAAWLAGKPEVRDPVVGYARAGGERLRQGLAVSGWAGRNADWLRLGGIVSALIALLVVSGSLWAIAVVLVLLALYELAVSWLAGSWPFAPRVAQPHA